VSVLGVQFSGEIDNDFGVFVDLFDRCGLVEIGRARGGVQFFEDALLPWFESVWKKRHKKS
jgi:hypothetical protein